VAIHTILYVRQVYPADLFVRRKKYETPVYQSRHPGLNEYIAGAIKAIGDELALVSTSNLCVPRRRKNEFSVLFSQGNVEKVVVVIKDKDEVALERFIFSIQTMIAVESFNKDTRLEHSSLLAHVTVYVFLS
jgi:mitotic spindle assembly checkpoint protein MAD2B